jgi:NMD protein affecting ribosome stability and mRNA decay
MFLKQKYFRSKKHLKLVASLPCQVCGTENQTQAAHSNWAELGGKAKSLKASDEYTAALCLKCHWEIDQGNKWLKSERQQAWKSAHCKTVQLLVDSGQWPVDIPIPTIAE